MASVFKAKGKSEYTIVYTDEHGKHRKGYTDKRESERLAKELEDRARRIKDGLDDPKAEAYRKHEGTPLLEHLAGFERSLQQKAQPRNTSR